MFPACPFSQRATLLACIALASCATQPPQAPVVAAPNRTPPTGADAPLLPFFQALDGLAAPGAAPVTILQIGDSHTANDSFSSRMRDRLQQRFGSAGRGELQPGIPFRWYRPENISVQASGFTTFSSFRPQDQGPFGIAAVRQHAAQPADALLTVTNGPPVTTVDVELLTQPGGGTVQITAPGAPPRNFATNGAGNAEYATVQFPTGATSISLHTNGDGPVDWLGWSISSGTPGIFYANLGTPGATIDILDRWDPAILRMELARLHPALILFAFGTNEAFKPSFDPVSYQANYAAKLALLHQDAPGATIIAIAPPDGQRARTRRGPPPGDMCDAKWGIPPYLAQVRAVQRVAAAQENAYFWDWSAAMGGPCAMARWADAVPQLGGPDHVHMRTAGYEITADVLFTKLMRAFDRYRGVPGGA
jgi:lysophospholipase L1-like esterase